MNTNNMDSKMKKILIFISLCIFAVASCTRPYEAHYDFGFDREELRFTAKDTAYYFMIYGEGSWTLRMSKEVAWVNIDKLSGAGNTQINVRVKQNEGVARDVEIIATYQDGREKTLIISQQASSSSYKAYSLSVSELNLLKMQRSFKVPATAKFAQEGLGELTYWVAYESEEDKDWIENLEFNYEDVEFSVKENTSAADRSASIYWTYPVAHWETPDTLSIVVNQESSLPSLGLEGSYSLDPAGLDSLKIYPDANWNIDIYDFDLSDFKAEGVKGEYVKSGNYLALIAERNVTGQSRSFNLEWRILENGEEVAVSSAELVQDNFVVSFSINDTYSLDPEGLDSLRIYPVINWDPAVFDFDLSHFTVSDGVTGKYVKSGNYLALIAQPNTSREARNFSLKWSVMDNGIEATSASSTLIQNYYIPPVDLTAGGKYAKCYILSDVEEGYYSADVRMVSGAKPAEDITSAAVLWESSLGLITRCSYDAENNKLYVEKARNAKGNAVVKLMDKDGNVRWSYHFWMTDSGTAVPEVTIGGYTFLDRNIGALTNKAPAEKESDAVGMHYQWGRKDPFPPAANLSANNANRMTVYPDESVKMEVAQSGVSLNTSIANPGTYYWGSGSSGNENWCSEIKEDYWSTTAKTDYDPCPYGYVVPSKAQLTAVMNNSKAVTLGANATCEGGATNFWASGGWYRRATSTASHLANATKMYYWTTDVDVYSTSYRGTYVYEEAKMFNIRARRWGANVRCVKETKTE